MKKIFSILVLATIMLAACTTDETQDLAVEIPGRITVVFEEDSRIQLNEELKTVWTKGDAVSVFYKSDSNDRYDYQGETGERLGVLLRTAQGTATVNNDKVVVVYPYNENYAISHATSSIDVTIPAVQYYTSGSYGVGANLMIASGDDSNFTLKNICGWIQLQFTGSEKLTKITLRGNNNEQIAGRATANYEEYSLALITANEGSDTDDEVGGTLVTEEEYVREITLDLGEGVQLTETPTDFYIVLAPQTFTKGITVTATADSGTCMTQTTDKEITISRNTIQPMTAVDYQLALEREALIAFYNALDGDNWTNNKNWCSDKPITEWWGVSCENGFVTKIDLAGNNLKGNIPKEIGMLNHLETLSLNYNDIYSLPKEIASLSCLSALYIGGNNNIIIPNELEQLVNLKRLGINEIDITALPFDLRALTNLEFLNMQAIKFESFPNEVFQIETLKELMYSYEPISSSLGNLINLECLTVGWIEEPCFIPKEVFNCTKLRYLDFNGDYPNYTLIGEIPSEIGNLKNLEILHISNALFTGGLPESITKLGNLKKLYLRRCNIGGDFPCDLLMQLPNLTQVSLEDNGFTGTITEEFASTDLWKNGWRWICVGNNLELTPSILFGPVPKETIYDNHGNIVDFEKLYKTNEYTIIFNWAYWCPTSVSLMEMLVDVYDKYHEKGVDIVGIYGDGYSESRSLLKSLGAQWRNIEKGGYNDNTYCLQAPYVGIIDVVDSSGHVVFNHIYDNPFYLDNWLEKQFDTSTDYSSDGNVTVLQKATKGEGVDVVLMGDGYSDRQIADGTYASVMQSAYEKFFSVEPYKSHKELFNVYYVTAVSATEGYEYGNTALDGYFGDGTLVGGDDSAAMNYALNAIEESRLDNANIVVMMNSENYAGTCYMYYPSGVNDYGSGVSVSYFPVGTEPAQLEQLLHHEACGHGFAKLADEYAYEYMGAVPADYVSQTQTQQRDWGWWKNVDFTSDPTAIRWSHFINDTRYANDGLGAFEGGLTYWSGVWRPTEDSIMRYNVGGFNAPSREAIYYRIHKLAYGDSWTYDYEKFVEWDAINRKSSAAQAASRPMVFKQYEPTAPPVVVGKSWREALGR